MALFGAAPGKVMQDMQVRLVRSLNPFHNLLVAIAVLATLLATFALAPSAQLAFAQQPQPAASATGSICVAAFEDTNKNANRDPGEPLLANVNVNLIVNNIIIENAITTGDQKLLCFDNLVPQQYTISFSSPLVQATTLTTFTFPLLALSPLENTFGRLRVSPGRLHASPSPRPRAAWPT